MKGLFIILMFPFVLFSNNEEQKTTLIVSSSGITIEDAKDNALRSAIEQSFGAFISSKTEVLNDEIKDEIVSISNGNIHNYKIISQVEIPDGGYSITLEATISVNQLTSFVRNKGIEVEFKGSLFGAEIRQQKLNEASEVIAVSNICNVSSSLLKESLDYNLEVSEPEMFSNAFIKDQWIVNLKVIITTNKNYEAFKNYFVSNLENLAMSNNEIEKYAERKKKYHRLEIDQNILFFRSDETRRRLQEFFTTSNYWLVAFNISNNIDTIKITSNNIYNDDHSGLNTWHLNNDNARFDHWESKNRNRGFPPFNYTDVRYGANSYNPRTKTGGSNWYFYMDHYIYTNYRLKHFKENSFPGGLEIGKLTFFNKEYIHKFKAAYSEDQLMQITKFKINKIKPSSAKKSSSKIFGIIVDPDGYTNMREESNTKSKVICKIYEGNKFLILDKSKNWWKIKHNGMLGYMHKSRIKIID